MRIRSLSAWMPCLLACILIHPLNSRADDGPGNALLLNGTSSYAQAPNGVWFNSDFTVEGWVYVRSYNSWSRLIDFANGPNLTNVYLAITAGTGGVPAMGVFQNVNGPVLSANAQVPLNQWTHLAATLQGTTGTIYINGVAVGSGTLNLAPNVVRTNNYVGRSNYAGDGYAAASFDELRIWNVARSASDLQSTMRVRLTGNEANLVGYWRMDTLVSGAVPDSSPHGNALTVFNAALTNSSAPIGPGPVTTLGAQSSGTLQETLRMQVQPSRLATAYFDYGPTPAFGNSSSAVVVNPATSQTLSSAPFTLDIPVGLQGFANQTLYYRAVMTNSLGMADGQTNSVYIAGQPPALCSDPAVCLLYPSLVTATSAVLIASVNPNNAAASVRFNYGPSKSSAGYGFVSTSTNLAASGSFEAAQIAVTGLLPNTLYYYGAVAANAFGAVSNNDLTFVTQATAPTVAGLAANVVSLGGVRLTGFVNANGSVTQTHFEYWPSDGGATNETTTNVVSGQGKTMVSADIGPLSPNTCYNWRLIAGNSSGATSLDASLAVCLGSVAPSVTTLPATGVSPHGAFLQGQINPNGLGAQGFFLWGASPTALTNVTATIATGAGVSPMPISFGLSGLQPSQLYFYRAAGSNNLGVQNGSVLTFTTPSALAPIPPPPGVYVVQNGHTRAATGYALTDLNGSIFSVVLTDGGTGYPSAPKVAFGSGGNGSGGQITAVLANGAVRSLTVNSAGSGYGSGTLPLIIDPPPNEIQMAAANSAYDTIVLPQGSVDATTVLSRSVIIRGQGANFTSVTGGGRDSVFHVLPGATVFFENLTITGGAAPNGGGILNYGGVVEVDACHIVNNSAAAFGGGIFNNGNAALTVNDSLISGNTAGLGGGGVSADGLKTASIPSLTNGLAALKSTVTNFYSAFQDFDNFSVYTIPSFGGGAQYVIPDLAAAIANFVKPGTIAQEADDLTQFMENFGSKFDNLVGGAVAGIWNYDFPSKIESAISHPFGPGAGGGSGGTSWLSFGASFCVISNTVITGNSVAALASGFGGGVHNQLGLMQITHSHLDGNQVTSHLASYGGAVANFVGAVQLDNSTANGNTASSSTVLSGGGAIFSLGGLLRVTNSTLNNNAATAKLFSSGGAIFNMAGGDLEASDCQMNSNSATAGGAIANDYGANAYVTNCLMTGNNVNGLISSYGGAVFNRDLASVTLYGCTLAGNLATGRAKGGAVYNQITGGQTNVSLPITYPSTATLINCTVASNSAVAGVYYLPNPQALAQCYTENYGNPAACPLSSIPQIAIPLNSRGGAFYDGAQSLALTSQGTGRAALNISCCTIAANTTLGSNAYGGAIYLTDVSSYNPELYGVAHLYIDNSILASNTVNGVSQNFSDANTFDPTVTTPGPNLSTDATLDNANVSAAWGLGPLAANGGATPTMAPLSGSLALNHGTTTLTLDQRGVARPQFGAPDMGAFEASTPLVANQSYTLLENENLSVAAANGVSSNAFASGLEVTLTVPPQHGQVTLSNDGSFLYQPASNYYGTDAFSFEGTDSYAVNTGAGVVSLTVVPVLDFDGGSVFSGNATAASRGEFDLTFGAPVDGGSAPGGIVVRGAESVTAPIQTATLGSNVTVLPEASFHAGELVTVELLRSLVGTNGGALTQSRTFQYVTAVAGGSGVFPSSVSLGSQGNCAVALADLDGNGTIDAYVAASSPSGNDQVWLNDGHGNFTLAQTLPGNSTGVALADLNGDGYPDAVVTKAGGLLGGYDQSLVNVTTVPSDYNRIYFNDGTGHFVEADEQLVPGTFVDYLTLLDPSTLTAQQKQLYARTMNQGSAGVAIGDLDGDGVPDVVLVNNQTTGIVRTLQTTGNSVWLNDGAGGLRHSQTFGDISAYAVALADVNGDGSLDIIIGDYLGVDIWLNDGAGHFTAGPSLNQGLGYSVHALAVGDVNGDGAMDIVASESGFAPGAWGNQVYLNDGHGNFTPAQYFAGQVQARALALGDLNGDGKLDLFGTGFFGEQAWTNNGAGVFAPVGPPFNTAYIGNGVALGDLDGDGDLDAFSVNQNSRSGVAAALVSFNDAAPIGINLQYTIAEGGSLNVAAPGFLGSVVDLDGPSLSFAATEPQVYVAPTLGQLFYVTASVANWDASKVGSDASGNWTYTDSVPLHASHGALSVHADGSFTYTPNRYFYGTDSFPLVVSDGILTTSNNVIITVTEIVQPPLTEDDYYPFSGGTLTVAAAQGVLANDFSQNSLPLSATLFQPPAHGNVALNADGSFTYTPNAGYGGSDVFFYAAGDGQATNTARVKIGNIPPVAASDYYPIPINGVVNIAASAGVLANDSDADGDALTAVLVAAPAHGSLTLNADGSFSYARLTNFTGDDNFTYQASDGVDVSAVVQARLGDRNPIAQNDAYTGFVNQALVVSPTFGLLRNDTDPDGYSLSAVLVNSPAHGALTLAANGGFTYTPQASFIGPDSFTYAATDGVAASAPATVSLSINSATLAVVNVSPAAMGPTNAPIQIQFNGLLSAPMAGVKLNIYGSLSGAHAWTGSVSNTILAVAPEGRFLPGEIVTVAVAPGVQGLNNIALAAGYSWTFNVAAPRGSGGFGRSALTPSPGLSYFLRPVAGDFAGNGHPDVIATFNADANNYYASLHRFLNNGDRTFTDTVFADPVNGYAEFYNTVLPGDFDGDGHLDLFVRANYYSGNVSMLWHNDGTGNFTGTTLPGNALDNQNDDNTFVAAADINGDGLLDVVGLGANGSIWSYTNDGVGHLLAGPSSTFSAISVADEALNAGAGAVCDVNGDGKPDLIIAPLGVALVWTNDGAGHFSPAPSLTDPTLPSPSYFGVAVGDFTGDAASDVILLNGQTAYSDPLRLFPGSVASFGAPSTVAAFGGVNFFNDFAGNVEGPPSLATADLTGRSRLDVTATGVGLANTVLFNNGAGGFNLTSLSSSTYNLGLALADFDGDGAVDIFAVGTTSAGRNAQETVYWNGRPPLAVNDFYPAWTTNVPANGTLANDMAGGGGALTAVLVTQPANATVTLSSNGGFTLAPGAGFAGVASFTYAAVDEGGQSYPARVKIGNSVPTAANQSYTVVNTSSLAVGVAQGLLAGASDADGDALAAVLLSPPAHGLLKFLPTGAFSYAPDPAFAGTDAFSFAVSDGVTNSATAFATITVAGPLDVTQLSPGLNALGVASGASVVITFDRVINSASVAGNIVLSGSQTGARPYSAATAGNIITLTPASAFRAGEIVSVTLTAGLRGQNGERFAAPFVWQFTVDAPTGRAQFTDTGKRYNYPPTTNVQASALADVNGDGKLDVIFATTFSTTNSKVVPNSSAVLVLTNDGAGNLTDSGQRLYNGNYIPFKIVPVDINNDGYIDFAVQLVGAMGLQVWTNNGAGNFSLLSSNGLLGMQQIAFPDLNGDGFPDLVGLQINFPTIGLTVATNNHAGGFNATYFLASSGLSALTVGDFNNDGKMDILEGFNGAPAITLLTNNGFGAFTQAAQFDAVNGYPTILKAADFNGDGYLDFVAWGNNIIQVWLNDRHGSFTNAGGQISLASGAAFSDIQAVDLNGDGVPDIVAYGASVVACMNNGQGLFGAPVTLSLPSQLKLASVGDLNGDGAPDFFLPGYGAASQVFTNQTGFGNLENAVVLRTTDHTNVAPFAGIALPGSGGSVSLTIALDTLANGVFTGNSATAAGFISVGNSLFQAGVPFSAAAAKLGSLVFAPKINNTPVGQTETTTLTVIISDGAVSRTNNVTQIIATALNDPPVAGNDFGAGFGATANTPFTTGNVLANDTDPNPGDAAHLSVYAFDAAGAIGSVSNKSDGTFYYNPSGRFAWLAAGQTYNDQFKYVVADPNGAYATGTVTIAVLGVSNPPSVPNATVSVAVHAAATDVTAQLLRNAQAAVASNTPNMFISAVHTSGTKGQVSLVAGHVVYNPNGAFGVVPQGSTVSDSFTFAVQDALGASATATASVTIMGQNDPPVAVADFLTLAANAAVTNLTALLLTNDYDADSLTNSALSIVGLSANGAQGSVTLSNGAVFYQPGTAFANLAPGSNAVDTFVYTVESTNGLTASAAVNITNVGVNYPPLAPDLSCVVGEGQTTNLTALILGAISDPNAGETITLRLTGVVTNQTSGMVALSAGTLTYQAAPLPDLTLDQTVTDTFSYIISDIHNASATGLVTITVTGQSIPPNAVADNLILSATAGTVDLTAFLLANDTDPNPLDTQRLYISGLYTNGTLGSATLESAELFYNPAPAFLALPPGQLASDHFVYSISDPFGAQSSAAVTVTVLGPPVITQASVVNQELRFSITGLSNTVCQVQSSSDLLTWSVLGTATETSPGNFAFTNAAPLNLTAQFYQATQTPTNVPGQFVR